VCRRVLAGIDLVGIADAYRAEARNDGDVVDNILYLDMVVVCGNEVTPYQNEALVYGCHNKAMGVDDSLIHLLPLVDPFLVMEHYWVNKTLMEAVAFVPALGGRDGLGEVQTGLDCRHQYLS
jgi:hypothetical protein